MLFEILSIIVTIFLALLPYVYNRTSRYNYLAGRWNDLMNINVDEPDFFNPLKTTQYQSTFNENKKTKYSQHARMHWGFVEDVIRQDHPIDGGLRFLGLPIESFVAAYRDTIKECINLHHAWLKDNKDKLFTYSKFRRVLKEEFKRELEQVGLEL